MTDRVLPHSLDAERSLLRAVLVDNEAFAVAAGLVTTGLFYRQAQRGSGGTWWG
jgi:replicative DNA helicase